MLSDVLTSCRFHMPGACATANDGPQPRNLPLASLGFCAFLCPADLQLQSSAELWDVSCILPAGTFEIMRTKSLDIVF